MSIGLNAYGNGTGSVQIGGSDAINIDTSLNVGIGTTSPAVAVDISSTANSTSGQLRISSNGSNGTRMGFVSTSTNGKTYQIGSNFINGTGEFGIYDSTAAATRMVIDTNGFLLVGVTDRNTYGGGASTIVSGGGVNTLTVANTGTDPYGIYVNYSTTDKNNTTNNFLQCAGAATVRASIRSNGGLANFSANNVNLSDRREKTNFAPAGNYLSKICAIPVQTFNYIDQNLEEDDGLTLGVVAQDVQAIAPELVTETDWGTKDEPKMRLSVYQTDLQYALMKCIQEQQAMIEELKTKVAALEAK